jgi:phage protein U
MFAVLGEILFEVLTSPAGFRAQTEYHYAEHQVLEAPSRLQWLADGLQRITLELGFHVAFTNPYLQMTLLYTAAELHGALPLVFGNGIYRGFFVIESIEEPFSKPPMTAAMWQSQRR